MVVNCVVASRGAKRRGCAVLAPRIKSIYNDAFACRASTRLPITSFSKSSFNRLHKSVSTMPFKPEREATLLISSEMRTCVIFDLPYFLDLVAKTM